MRIVQLNPYHYPYMGGIERRVHEVCRRLSHRHEMIVLTSQLPGTVLEEEMDGYRVVRLPSHFINIYNPPYVSTPGVLKALERLSPDVVDFHYRWAPSYTRAMKRYAGRWTFTFHNTYGEGQGVGRLMSTVNDALFCRLIKDKRIICITEFVKNDLIRRGFRTDLLEVIPPGVDLPSERGQEGDYILFVGRLVGTKGLPYLVKAMAQVNAPLFIVGDGPDRKALEEQVRSAGLGDRITLTGRVSEERKTELVAGCRLFVMPSVFESYGLAVAEAMAWGKPVVASRVGGLPEVVGEGGLLVPPRDGAALADALNAMLGDDSTRHAHGLKAREHIQGYSWQKVADSVEISYRTLAGQ